MRILILTTIYPHVADPVRGIYVHRHARALMKAGCEVEVIAPVVEIPFISQLSPRGRALKSVPRHEFWEGVSVHHPRRFGTGSFLHHWSSRFYGWLFESCASPVVQRLHNKAPFDIIDAHVPFVAGEAALSFAGSFNLPLCVSIHGFSLRNVPEYGRWAVRRIQKVLHGADRVVVTGPFLNKKVMAPPWNISAEHISMIRLGVDLSLVPSHKDQQLADEFSGCKVALVPGNLVRLKRHDLVLEALSRLRTRFKSLRVVIIGSGHKKEELLQLASRSGLNDRVIFIDQLPQTELFRYYSVADIVVLPSHNEAFGIVYLEAAACGKPFIACEGQGIEQFAREHQAGILVPLDNAGAVAQAMEYLLTHPEQARQMGHRGRKAIERYYTWEENARQSMDLFKQVIQSRKRTREAGKNNG